MRKVNEVVVVALDKRYKRLEGDLKRRTEKLLLLLKQNKAGVEIYLVGSSRMRKLNEQYRGRSKITNVLAFPSPRNFPQIRIRFLGEIYLCPPYIKEKREDMGLLLAHGMLHLLGFNHQKESDRMTMVRMEKQLTQWLNR